MNDGPLPLPAALYGIEGETTAVGFTMISEHKTGALLRTLAASKPGGTFLELGTGTGASTSWILDGMDAAATLLTVDNEARFVEIARRHLGHDRRVTFHIDDCASFRRITHPAGSRRRLSLCVSRRFNSEDRPLSLP